MVKAVQGKLSEIFCFGESPIGSWPLPQHTPSWGSTHWLLSLLHRVPPPLPFPCPSLLDFMVFGLLPNHVLSYRAVAHCLGLAAFANVVEVNLEDPATWTLSFSMAYMPTPDYVVLFGLIPNGILIYTNYFLRLAFYPALTSTKEPFQLRIWYSRTRLLGTALPCSRRFQNPIPWRDRVKMTTTDPAP